MTANYIKALVLRAREKRLLAESSVVCKRLKLLFTIVSIIAGTIILFYSRKLLAEAILPYFQFVISLLEKKLDIESFSVITNGSEEMFNLRLVKFGPIEIYDVPFPRMDASGSTLVSHLLIQMIIYYLALLIGLLYLNIDKLKLIILVVLASTFTLGIDVPFVLVASIHGLILEYYAPDLLNTNLLVQWERFMSGGGRLVLPIGLSLLCLSLSSRRTPAESSAIIPNRE